MSILATAALTAGLLTGGVAELPQQPVTAPIVEKGQVSTMAVTNTTAVLNYFLGTHASTKDIAGSGYYAGSSSTHHHFTLSQKNSSVFAAHINVNKTTGAYDIEFHHYFYPAYESGVLPSYLR